jgi:AraC-like DNA-binding protein
VADQSLVWLELMLVVTMSIGCWLSINLLFNRTGKASANRILAFLVSIQLIPLINVYSKVAFNTNEWIWVLTTNLSWLYGPILLLFIQINQNKEISYLKLSLHFSPFFLTLLFREIYMPSEASLFLIVPLFMQMLWYLVLSINTYLRNNREVLTAKNNHFSWPSYLISGLIILMFMDVFFISKAYWFEPMLEENWFILISFIAIYILGISFFSVYRPHVFYNACIDLIDTTMTKPTKEFKELDENIALMLANDLEALMERDKPFLDNELTLPMLAVKLSVSRHQLSELLNVHLKKTFYEFINQYRCERAVEILKNNSNKQAILDIGFASGFNNKNSFYRLFKNSTGYTPAQFRRMHLAK